MPPMAGTTAFGRSVPSGIAQKIMDAPSVNQTDSPSEPEKAPSDGLAKFYAQLHGIAKLAIPIEQDPQRLDMLKAITEGTTRAIKDLAQSAGSGGAPVPHIEMPPPPPPAPAPGPPNGNPAAPAGTPGPPAGPPPPGA